VSLQISVSLEKNELSVLGKKMGFSYLFLSQCEEKKAGIQIFLFSKEEFWSLCKPEWPCSQNTLMGYVREH